MIVYRLTNLIIIINGVEALCISDPRVELAVAILVIINCDVDRIGDLINLGSLNPAFGSTDNRGLIRYLMIQYYFKNKILSIIFLYNNIQLLLIF